MKYLVFFITLHCSISLSIAAEEDVGELVVRCVKCINILDHIRQEKRETTEWDKKIQQCKVFSRNGECLEIIDTNDRK